MKKNSGNSSRSLKWEQNGELAHKDLSELIERLKNVENEDASSELSRLATKSNKIDFLFVTKWTDFKEYKAYCFENDISTVEFVSDILKIEDLH